MADDNRHSFLRPGGAKLFKEKTAKKFALRKNKTLLKIDKALKDYEVIPREERKERTAALVAIISLCDAWIDAKAVKLDHGESFRYPAISLLQSQAVKTLSALEHWAAAKSAFAKLIPKGSLHGRGDGVGQPPLKHLEAPRNLDKDYSGFIRVNVNNWLEVIDTDHRRGAELKPLFQAWLNSNETCSFWTYLDKQAPSVKKDLEKVEVHYNDDLIFRALFEVNFDNGVMYSRMSPLVQAMIVHKLPRRKVFIDAIEQPLDTSTWPSAALIGFTSGWACFVLSAQHVLYAGIHMGGQFHHTSFLAGAPVLAAGMIQVKQGRIVAIHEKNGHYQAQATHMETFLRLLVRKMPGTNWSKVAYTTFGGMQTNVATVLGLPVPPPRPPRPVILHVHRPLPSIPQQNHVQNMINRFQHA
ncbi:hypothetical protein [Terrarubrum flagellatum]|uniref:hypothetical protein n=1 Tax=Terrirubrum flagellatum TaxID=2895980 RepID=UPI0031452932